MKKHDVEFYQKKFKKPVQQQRLLIVACLCACQRRRMIVKYNHEKKQEIKRFQEGEGSFQPEQMSQGLSDKQEIPGLQESYMSSGASQQQNLAAQSSANNYTLYRQRYLHDMRQEQEALQDKIACADKVLQDELRVFKKRLATDFQELVRLFHAQTRNTSTKVGEKWQLFAVLVEEKANQMLNQTQATHYSSIQRQAHQNACGTSQSSH